MSFTLGTAIGEVRVRQSEELPAIDANDGLGLPAEPPTSGATCSADPHYGTTDRYRHAVPPFRPDQFPG